MSTPKERVAWGSARVRHSMSARTTVLKLYNRQGVLVGEHQGPTAMRVIANPKLRGKISWLPDEYVV